MLLAVNFTISLFFMDSLPMFDAKHTKRWRRTYACTHALSRMQKSQKKGNIVDHAFRLLCTWCRVEMYGVLETCRVTHTHTPPELSTTPGPASLHARLGRRIHVNDKERNTAVLYLPFTKNETKKSRPYKKKAKGRQLKA